MLNVQRKLHGAAAGWYQGGKHLVGQDLVPARLDFQLDHNTLQINSRRGEYIMRYVLKLLKIFIHFFASKTV